MAGRAGRTFLLRPEIRAPRTLVSRTDAIPPIIAVGKASARITHYRGFDLPHFVNQFFADAIHVRNFGLLAHPDAVVDHSAKIFGEVTVDVGRDRSQWLAQEDLDPRVVADDVGGGKRRNPVKPQVARTRHAAADKFSASDHAHAPH